MTSTAVWRLSIAALMSVVPLHARAAGTSTFSVNPVQIHLTAKSPSTLLSVRNDSDHELRFQLSAFAWEQTLHDQMQLLPTSEIVFYPPLITLAPRRSARSGSALRRRSVRRKRRIASSSRSFRISTGTERTPPASPCSPRWASQSSSTLRARSLRRRSRRLALADGQISFQLRNTGNTHFVADKIVVRGFGGAGDVVFDTPISGWYVLAGRVRAYQIDIPAQDCARVTATTVKVQIGTSELNERLATPSACRP